MHARIHQRAPAAPGACRRCVPSAYARAPAPPPAPPRTPPPPLPASRSPQCCCPGARAVAWASGARARCACARVCVGWGGLRARSCQRRRLARSPCAKPARPSAPRSTPTPPTHPHTITPVLAARTARHHHCRLGVVHPLLLVPQPLILPPQVAVFHPALHTPRRPPAPVAPLPLLLVLLLLLRLRERHAARAPPATRRCVGRESVGGGGEAGGFGGGWASAGGAREGAGARHDPALILCALQVQRRIAWRSPARLAGSPWLRPWWQCVPGHPGSASWPPSVCVRWGGGGQWVGGGAGVLLCVCRGGAGGRGGGGSQGASLERGWGGWPAPQPSPSPNYHARTSCCSLVCSACTWVRRWLAAASSPSLSCGWASGGWASGGGRASEGSGWVGGVDL